MKKIEEIDLITPREAAGILGVSPRTIEAWIQGGKIEHFRLAHNCVRISRRYLLEEFLASRKTEARGRR
jgi:excisionase family DNA binding protein